MSNPLGRTFFRNRTTLQLAKDLLGCVLVHETPGGVIAGTIRETEAYTETDEATHTFGGRKSPRNEVMFSDGGHLYVYFTYGMYHCANVVSERKGRGCAVLLRAVTLTDGIDLARKNRIRARRGKTAKTATLSDRNLADGPAKLCQAFGFDRKYNGIDLINPKNGIYILPRKRPVGKITRTPRIGISKARDKMWRFLIP